MTKTDHLPALDGLRGFAALLVVVAHLPKAGLAAAPAPLSGPLGVMLFFILSGFLMGHLYLTKPFDRAACSRYLAARAARVLPLYYAVVVTCFVLSKLLGPAFSFNMGLGSLSRLLLLVGHDYVFWSIPPEVQFYFIFLIPWALAEKRRLTAWLPVTGLVIATIFLLRPLFPGISALGQLQIFLTGVLVAVARRRLVTRIEPRAALMAQIAGLLLCGFTIAGLIPINGIIQGAGRSKDDIAYASLPLSLVVGSVLLAYSIETPFARAIFANRIARLLGAWSFGIYLLHWPIMHGVHWALAGRLTSPIEIGALGLAVTVGAAAFVHYAFEMPVQRVLRPWLARLIDRPLRSRF